MVGIATLLSVPLGIATAVFLSEIRGRLARPVRMIVDAMSAIPSIVAGLFIYAAFIIALHQQQTGFAAALALAVLMLPTVTRTAEVVLRLVPGGLREASLALGGGEWATVRRIILPTARAGLAHRGDPRHRAGHRRDRAADPHRRSATRRSTATRSTASRTRCRCSSIASSASRRRRQIQRAWTGALVLLGLVLVLFIIARIIGGRGPGHIGRFKRARLARKGLS